MKHRLLAAGKEIKTELAWETRLIAAFSMISTTTPQRKQDYNNLHYFLSQGIYKQWRFA